MSEKQKCSEMVSEGFHVYPCPYTGKHQEDGKWWCGTHRPSAVKARREKRNEQWRRDLKARRANEDALAARLDAERAVVEAAVAWRESTLEVRDRGMGALPAYQASVKALAAKVDELIALRSRA